MNTAESNKVIINNIEPQRPPVMGWIAKYAIFGIAWWLVYRSLQSFTEWLTYQVLGLSRSGHMGSAVAFFLFEAPKVLMLLTLIVFVVGIIRSYFTPERTRQILAGRREIAGTVLAFMMAVIGLSLPEMIILRNVLKKQLIAVFVGVVATGIVIVGYLFNFIF